MTDDQQQQPEEPQDILKSPFGSSVTLNLDYGYNDYIAATIDTLNRIQQTGYPGDPQKTANMLIFEIFNYLEGLLPNIDIREAAAFYGAAIGIGVGGHVASGTLPESAGDQIAAVFYAAMRNTIPVAQQLFVAMEDQDEHGLVAPDGSPVSSKAPDGRIPRMPRPKRHGKGKRKRRK